jgi:sugar phosphate isomerase/epimerase
MIIGCFALVEPFAPMQRQFQAIREMGIRYADLTDNHNGGMLGDGVIGIPKIVEALLAIGFAGPTTLEVAGPDSVKLSAKRLQEWSGK